MTWVYKHTQYLKKEKKLGTQFLEKQDFDQRGRRKGLCQLRKKNDCPEKVLLLWKRNRVPHSTFILLPFLKCTAVSAWILHHPPQISDLLYTDLSTIY